MAIPATAAFSGTPAFSRDSVEAQTEPIDVEPLFHLEHVQRGDTHDLGLAAFEDGRAVDAGQNLNLGGELADVRQATAVDADLVLEDALAHYLLGDGAEGCGQLLLAAFELAGQ